MKRSPLPIILFLLCTGCGLFEGQYVSTDYGANDYLPLAVGNTWYYEVQKIVETLQIGQQPQTSIQNLGAIIKTVDSVKKLDAETEVFILRVVEKQSRDSSVSFEEVKRTRSSMFLTPYGTFPRTGAEDEFYIVGIVQSYKKGVGMISRSFGQGFTTRTYSERYQLILRDYKVKK